MQHRNKLLSHTITLAVIGHTHNYLHVLKITKCMLNWCHTKLGRERENAMQLHVTASLCLVLHALLLTSPCSCSQAHIL